MITFASRVTDVGARKFDANLDKASKEAAERVAQFAVKKIKENWTAPGPSVKGQPPAVDSGDLDRSIKAVRRDEAGRFANFGKATRFYISAGSNESTGAHPGGVIYAGRLEYEMQRPYFEPAMKEAQQAFQYEFTSLWVPR